MVTFTEKARAAMRQTKGASMLDYRKTTALVTGASSGLGAEFARALAKRGANLILVARTKPALEQLGTELMERHKVRVKVFAADLASPLARRALHSQIEAEGLAVNLLVNNAGFGLSGPFLTHSLESEEAQIDVNVAAVTALSHLFGQNMKRFGKNSGIINVASNAAFQPLPYSAVYSASKSFVLLFSEALNRELRTQGTHVLAVCPGAIATPFWGKIGSDLPDAEKSTPERIVEEALRAFDRRQAVVVPGPFRLRLQIFSTRFAPRSFVARVAEGASRSIMMRGREV